MPQKKTNPACDLSTPEVLFRSLPHAEPNIHTISFWQKAIPYHRSKPTFHLRTTPDIYCANDGQ